MPLSQLFFTRKIKQLSYLIIISTTAVFAQNADYLGNFQQMTQNGNSIAPVFSPMDSTVLAFTQLKFQGIYLLHLNSSVRSTERIDSLTEAQAGFGFSWASDGENIITRTSNNAQKQVGMINILTQQYTDFTGNAQKISLPTVRKNTAFFINDNAKVAIDISQKRSLNLKNVDFPVFERNARITVGDKIVNPDDMQCWLPKISPNGEKLSFECWDGLYLYDITEENRIHLGKGTNAQWSQDSQRLIYEKTSDDGHIITASDIFMVNNDGRGEVNLTANIDEIVRRPSFSPDGKQVAVDIDGNIFIADLIEGDIN